MSDVDPGDHAVLYGAFEGDHRDHDPARGVVTTDCTVPSASSAFPSPRFKLVDFGLSKQLPEHMRLSFALLVTAMAPGAAGADPLAVSAASRVKNGV